MDQDDIRCEQLKDYAIRSLAILRKREELIQQMVDLSKERNEYRILISIPGIGENTAVRLIGEIGGHYTH
ncbi:hypothetical protein [Bacillus methanolicus]|uniref:Transposase IS116/IS110/IS902 family protein n=1 Tax=Bacillus methanolicus (strain MGA3 / ATCC 53907) TaxID=796606 RepID=I3E7F9_BACMM|nr:hypothetical protein [Bacillus methanolicus]AIE59256.1 hypothetical protein BMMGA3_04080 [Bacillus methanolicus MGA3]EIJ82430.1 transposase, IS111A/IS1328/IS1533/IS116/IS110/IS902 [Bacillus methanolicus MGA3]